MKVSDSIELLLIIYLFISVPMISMAGNITECIVMSLSFLGVIEIIYARYTFDCAWEKIKG